MSKSIPMEVHTNNICRMISIGGNPEFYWQLVRTANKAVKARKGGDN